jgi:hypothetical protein
MSASPEAISSAEEAAAAAAAAAAAKQAKKKLKIEAAAAAEKKKKAKLDAKWKEPGPLKLPVLPGMKVCLSCCRAARVIFHSLGERRCTPCNSSADDVRDEQGALLAAHQGRHSLHDIYGCIHACCAVATGLAGRRAPPLAPTPCSHTRTLPPPQTVYLQQWLAHRQLVSLYLPCNNVQKKGFLSIAKYGAPRLASQH